MLCGTFSSDINASYAASYRMIDLFSFAYFTHFSNSVLSNTVPVGLFGKHKYIRSTLSFGNSGLKSFSAVTGKYTIFSYVSVSLLYFPLLPDITFVSKYTGYTGSVIATLLSFPNISTIFPQSHFEPSDTNISSVAISIFLAL